MPVTLPSSRIGTTIRSSGTRRWTGRLALGLGDQRHGAALLRNSGSRPPSRPCRSARRGCEKMPSAFDGLRRGRSTSDSRAGSMRRRRTSSAARAPSGSSTLAASARICACICGQSRTAARTSASTACSSSTSSRRPRASARSSSMYIIDSRRLLSSHSGSSACSLPSSSRSTQTTGCSRRWMVSCRAGDGVGDAVDQERHVVVDDAQPHPPPAGLAAGRFEADRDLALAPLGGDLGDEARRLFLLARR